MLQQKCYSLHVLELYTIQAAMSQVRQCMKLEIFIIIRENVSYSIFYSDLIFEMLSEKTFPIMP